MGWFVRDEMKKEFLGHRSEKTGRKELTGLGWTSVLAGGLALSAVFLNTAGSFVVTQEGTIAGHVQSLSQQGLAIKTLEGTLSTGVSNDPTQPHNTFAFSVPDRDEAVVAALNKAVHGRDCVVLSFEKTLGRQSWRQDTRVAVTGVEVVGSNCANIGAGPVVR